MEVEIGYLQCPVCWQIYRVTDENVPAVVTHVWNHAEVPLAEATDEEKQQWVTDHVVKEPK